MTVLGDAVKQQLDRRGISPDAVQIEKILREAGVSPNASRGVPARLRVRRLHVTGTKQYPTNPDAPDVLTVEPIRLDWSPVDGVNGVGSGANLRGKSSVLLLALWAMTGRSHLQDDVQTWADHVAAEFTIDGVSLYVDFDVDVDGVPSGTVHQQVHSTRALLGTFRGETQFESVMGSVMLDRLRLDVIPVFTKGKGETDHQWPSYAASLTVHANQLDPIVGNENVLKTRALQMFLGTEWAAIDAQVATALKALQFDQEQAVERSQAAASVTATMRSRAEQDVVAARARFEQFDSSSPDVNAVLALTAVVSDRAREVQDLNLELMNVRAAHDEASAQLRAEELRRQVALEDAVARSLFNGMAPTACPRCSNKVTKERYEAESTSHACSVCSSEIKVVLPADANVPTTAEDGDAKAVDTLDALRAAVAASESAVNALQTRVAAAETDRTRAEDDARRAHDSLDSARARLSAEIELARAEGALAAITQVDPADEGPRSEQDDEHLVLAAASVVTKRWIKDDQDPLLVAVSTAITTLARSFGATNITAVHLKGNGNMDVDKGGVDTTYSGLTNGEKLRIKLAAAIALVQVGHRSGVGRHPGLLFVDSPTAEEIPESDLRTMLRAMNEAAQETDMQIVVATTHGPMLNEVLAPDHLLVATGNDYVW